MDKRLIGVKNYPRAMRPYSLMLYEFVLEYKPKKMLELGVCTGQSTRAILLAMKDSNFGKLISVDHKDRSTIFNNGFVNENDDLCETMNAGYEDLKEHWVFVKGDTHSDDTLKLVKDCLEDEELFDMAFIDAGHSYEDIKKDWELFYPLIKKGGIIMLHDTVNTDQGVRLFWEEIKDEKFNINWGATRRNNFIPGFGIVRKT